VFRTSLVFFQRKNGMSMYVGESLVGEGNEVAHIDLLIGDKSGPVGVAFANSLADQKQGHSNLLAVMTPNVAVKPSTVIITKVTLKGAGQVVQMFGPAQKAVADAVADCVKSGVIHLMCLSVARSQYVCLCYLDDCTSPIIHTTNR
jgi:formaldehyde-activating enzyme